MKLLLKVKKVRNSFAGMMFDFFLETKTGKLVLWVIMHIGFMIIGKSGALGTFGGSTMKSFLNSIANFENTIIKRSLSLISAFSSIGGYIALLLDLMDKKWDDNLTIKIKG